MSKGFPPTPKYPKALDTDYTLYLVHNTAESVTTTENPPWSEEIVIAPVGANDNELWADNGFANIEGELFYYDSVSKDENGKVYKLKGCIRNIGGTNTKFNPIGSDVRGFVVAEHHNQLVKAILNIESFVGENFTTKTSTLDWRVRNLRSLPIIVDDYSCPDVVLQIDTISTDSTSGTVVEYDVQITGQFNDYRLDFGDGNYTTTETSGTHTYAPNATIDPAVTISNERCTIVQTAIERSSPTEPRAQVSNDPFEIKIPTSPEIPDFIFPDFTIPDVPYQPPAFVGPCIDFGPVGAIPSVITVDPPIDIPSVITITPITFPTEISIAPISLAGSVDIPTAVSITPVFIPTLISITPVNIPTLISITSPNIPTYITITPVDIPTLITITPVDIPSYISITPIDLPTQISITPVDIPTYISISPVDIPTYISITPVNFPSSISLDASLISVDWSTAPTLSIDWGTSPSIPSVTWGTPPTISIDWASVPAFPEITFEAAPTIPAITWAAPPTISVDWGTPPTCSVIVSCDGGGGAFAAQSAPLTDDFADDFGLEELKVEYSNLGIPSEIQVKFPEIKDLRVLHDIPVMIELKGLKIPKEIEITGNVIPTEITLKDNLPKSIELIATDIPKSIALDTSSLPAFIPIVPAPDFPTKIELDASGLPDKIQVVGIPDTIELVGDIPSEINLKMPENPEVRMVYDGAPIDVKVQLDITKLTGDEDLNCVALVPCKPKK